MNPVALSEELYRLGVALDALQPHVPDAYYRQARADLEAVRDALKVAGRAPAESTGKRVFAEDGA